MAQALDRAERLLFPERPQLGRVVPVWGGLTAAAIVIACVVFGAALPEAGMSPDRTIPSPPSPAVAAVIRPVTTDSLVAGRGGGERAPRGAPAPKAETARLPTREVDLGPYRIRHPFIIVDGITFGPEGAKPTRLAGLRGPPAGAVCFDRNGQLWACGLQARAALSRLIVRQEVECTPTAITETAVESRCRVDGRDLGDALTEAGFARHPADDGVPARQSAARDAGLGLWNGGWRIR